MKSGYFAFIKNFFVCAALMLFVAGCGTNNTTADSNTGAIVAKLAWSSDSNTSSSDKIIAKAAAGVATVRIIVIGSGMTDMQRDFVAADGGGVIEGIPSGSGRTLKAQGLDAAGFIIYQGEIKNITVQAGQLTDVGIIVMVSVTSSNVAPITNATVASTSLLSNATASYDFNFYVPSGLPAGATFTVVFPAGFNLAGATKVSNTYYSIQSISGQTITYKVETNGALVVGDYVFAPRTTTSGILNPSTSGTYNFTISTSNDPTPVSVPVTIKVVL